MPTKSYKGKSVFLGMDASGHLRYSDAASTEEILSITFPVRPVRPLTALEVSNRKSSNFIRANRRALDLKLNYYGRQCRYCKVDLLAGFNLTWDHAIPRSRGGKNLLSNMVPAWLPCNSRKATKNMLEFLASR